jgi:hypothetical protein
LFGAALNVGGGGSDRPASIFSRADVRDGSFASVSDVGVFLNEVNPTPTNGHHAAGRPSPKSCQIRKSPRFFDGADEHGPDDRIHDGSGGHHHSGPETKSSPSPAARLRFFDCRTSPARPTGIAVEKTRRMQITVQRMRTWLPRAAPHIAGAIHFSARLFQHINGLSPTSQFSPSGGAGGNAPTRGAEMRTWPSI